MTAEYFLYHHYHELYSFVERSAPIWFVIYFVTIYPYERMQAIFQFVRAAFLEFPLFSRLSLYVIDGLGRVSLRNK